MQLALPLPAVRGPAGRYVSLTTTAAATATAAGPVDLADLIALGVLDGDDPDDSGLDDVSEPVPALRSGRRLRVVEGGGR